MLRAVAVMIIHDNTSVHFCFATLYWLFAIINFCNIEYWLQKYFNNEHFQLEFIVSVK